MWIRHNGNDTTIENPAIYSTLWCHVCHRPTVQELYRQKYVTIFLVKGLSFWRSTPLIIRHKENIYMYKTFKLYLH